ncbi:MAG: ATP-binding cassette domain-containing protein [Magnetococcales bacterium]|nr:ATP-binding cassette domain-containing protein [Magnetococcales bacterium]
MKELFRFLASRPLLLVELLLASLLINLLGLASSLYIMQVLSRYVSSGVDATLVTLTAGVVVAVVAEWLLRQLRRHLAGGVIHRPMGRLSAGFFNSLLGVRLLDLLRLSGGERRELINHLATAQKTYTPAAVVTVLDLPFAFLFVGALFLINHLVAVIAAVFLLIVFLITLVHQRRLALPTQQVAQQAARHGSLTASVMTTAESVRVFRGAELMRRRWWEHQVALHRDQVGLTDRQDNVQTLTQGIGTLMGVAVIAAGAKLANMGLMDTSLLVGSNIIASRAMSPVLRFAQIVPQLAKARQGLETLVRFGRLSMEKTEGVVLREFTGRIELQSVGFSWPGAKGSLFESLTVVAESGQLLAVIGSNGTGKTTLLRLLAGVLEPQRGRILVDGYSQEQLDPDWWRQQLLYIPQEPLFMEASLRDNLLTMRPDMDDEELNALVDRTGLRRFVNENTQGLDLVLAEGGHYLSPGIRRRIALARALAADGQLVLMDEPLEGVDAEGRQMFLELMRDLIAAGRTVVAASHDAGMAKVAHQVIDLDSKPVPMVRTTGSLSAKEGQM